MPTKKKLKKRIERLNKIIDWYADRLDELEAREIGTVFSANNTLQDAARSIGKLWGHNLTGFAVVEEGDIVVGDSGSENTGQTDPIQAPKPRIPPCRNYENYGGTEDD